MHRIYKLGNNWQSLMVTSIDIEIIIYTVTLLQPDETKCTISVLVNIFLTLFCNLFIIAEQFVKPGLMEYNQMAVPISKSSKTDKLPVLVDWDSSDRLIQY